MALYYSIAPTLFSQELLEGLVIDRNVSHGLQLLPALLLLLKQLPLSSNISSMELLQHIFPEWLDRFSRYDAIPHGCLNDDLEHLPVNVFFELLNPLPT